MRSAPWVFVDAGRLRVNWIVRRDNPAKDDTLRYEHRRAGATTDRDLTPMLLAQIANQATTTVTETGVGLGSIIAVVCSWQRNRSVLWAILAGILSWIYVIYFALTRRLDEVK
jgi:hypothetical protein